MTSQRWFGLLIAGAVGLPNGAAVAAAENGHRRAAAALVLAQALLLALAMLLLLRSRTLRDHTVRRVYAGMTASALLAGVAGAVLALQGHVTVGLLATPVALVAGTIIARRVVRREPQTL